MHNRDPPSHPHVDCRSLDSESRCTQSREDEERDVFLGREYAGNIAILKSFLQAGIDPNQEACSLARHCGALLVEATKILSSCSPNMGADVSNEDFPSILTGKSAIYPSGLGTATQAACSSGYRGIAKLLLTRKYNISRLGDLSGCNSGTSLTRSRTDCTVATGKAKKRGHD